ncbi:SOS response-associated peptidase, partial [Burkholderia gladioli]
MCGRYARGRGDLFYIEPLMTDANDPRWKGQPDLFRPSWNVSPGTKQPIITPDGPRVEPWGYRPGWAVARKVPMLINARLDKSSSSAWKSMFTRGRVLIPADGWYEWLPEGGKKQPYFIHSKDGPPIFFAGLTSAKPVPKHPAPDAPPPDAGTVFGFVIVTAPSESGMLDVHDRRPLVLTLEEARIWLDPDTTFDEAVHLANTAGKSSDDFAWYKVTQQVNKSGAGNDSPTFVEPVEA